MSNTEKIFVTKRVMDYIQTHVDPSVKDKWLQFLQKCYIEMEEKYNECIASLGPIEAYKLALEEIDDALTEENIMEKGVTCKIGCSHCCHIAVDSQQIEVELILQYCNQNNITIDKSYLQTQAKWKKSNIFDHPTHSACVFLKDNKCSIYEVRPAACRNHYVFSDPALCNAKKFRPPAAGIAMSFHFPTEIFMCVIADKNNSKRGWFVDLLLKNIS